MKDLLKILEKENQMYFCSCKSFAIFLLIFFFLGGINSNSVFANSEVKNSDKSKWVDIVDYVVDGEILWAVNAKGVILGYNAMLQTTKTLDIIKTKYPIVSIWAQSSTVLLVADATGEIYQIDVQKNISQKIYSSGRRLLKIIAIDSHLYGIDENGVYDFETKEIYPFTKHLNPESIQFSPEFKRKFNISLIADSNKCIWIGFDYWEWGGELYIFNTNDHNFENIQLSPGAIEFDSSGRHFVSPVISFTPIKSITNRINDAIYIEAGIVRFSYNGFVYRFEKDVDKYKGQIIYSSSKLFGTKEEYIGGGTYNKYDNHIYLFTNNGFKYFYKNEEDDYRTAFWRYPEVFFQDFADTKLLLSSAVVKMDFINANLLVFLDGNSDLHFFPDNE